MQSSPYGSLSFLLFVSLGVAFVIFAVVRSKKRLQSAEPHTLLDYFLLWPLIFDQPARRERMAVGGRFFTIGEIIGAIFFVAILIVGMVFF